MKIALSFPPTPTELLILATDGLNDAAHQTRATTIAAAHTWAEIAHGAATLLLVAKLEEMEQRHDQRETRAELRRAKLDTATDEILEKAKPLLIEQLERMGKAAAGGPASLRREEILTILEEHDVGDDARELKLDRNMLEDLVRDLLGERREIPTSGNGVYADAGKWWVDLSRTESVELPKCCLGPFDSEAEADAAAAYAFATHIANGGIPTTQACLAHIHGPQS